MPEALRYPSCILATAVTPWTEDWRLDERLFRRQIAKLLALGYRHLYIFGTAGEAHAVDGPRIDSAYDKVLWKLHDPEFPLRLLPPYESAGESAADDFRAFLEATYPHWAPND